MLSMAIGHNGLVGLRVMSHVKMERKFDLGPAQTLHLRTEALIVMVSIHNINNAIKKFVQSMEVGPHGLSGVLALQHVTLGFKGATVHAPTLTLHDLETIASELRLMIEYVFNNRVQMEDGQAGITGLCVVLHVAEE